MISYHVRIINHGTDVNIRLSPLLRSWSRGIYCNEIVSKRKNGIKLYLNTFKRHSCKSLKPKEPRKSYNKITHIGLIGVVTFYKMKSTDSVQKYAYD